MTRNNHALSALASALVNRYQGGFPLTESPFADVARELGSSETIIIETLQQLLDQGWLTRFGPLYDAAALGGGLTLAAVCAAEKHFEQIADIINQFPQVAHNYRREHELNMWFVIATETPGEIASTIARIEQDTGLEVYNFPKQREFYVGLWLKLEHDKISTVPVPGLNTPATRADYRAEDIDRQIIALTQSGLPLCARPWDEIANQLTIDTDILCARLQHMLDSGIIRRIGVVPNHYKLGLRANGMSVWDVSEEKIEQLGKCIGSFDFVSHCYQRPRHLPEWRYNLFAMVHGHDRDEVDDKVARIALELGEDCVAHDVLYSSSILKKTGMRLVA